MKSKTRVRAKNTPFRLFLWIIREEISRSGNGRSVSVALRPEILRLPRFLRILQSGPILTCVGPFASFGKLTYPSK